ncbi:hypothetical protein [Marinivivus vitaminiproducens]|uniref:hypothetical protein n=1 Tax=Marinivivus vitaminiproducens TaxID=3035935 RepID=UPI00279E9E32|nr:hypothetical protein P4R82_18010 [Geminicoccaceae bacterium SCSIO 64248]
MADLPEALRRLAEDEPEQTVAVVIVLADVSGPAPEELADLAPVAGLKGILCGRLRAGRLTGLARSPAVASIEPDSTARMLDAKDGG